MPDSTGHHLVQVLRRVLRQPYTLAVVFVGGMAAIILHSGVPLIGAAVLLAVYAVVKLRDEEFIRHTLREAEDARARAERQNRMFRIEELDVESRVRMKTIVKLQGEIHDDVVNSPVDEVAAGLCDTVEETEKIVDRGLAMSQKHSELTRYLNKTDKHGIEMRIHSLQTRLVEETDVTRRADIESQIASKQRELEDRDAIEAAARRVLDQLDGIEAAFSGLRARLVRIKSTDVADWVAANTELKTELEGLQTAVNSVEQSIAEVLTVRGGG